MAPRVLIVEAEPGLSQALRARLGEAPPLVVAGSLAEALAASRQCAWDAVLVDVRLPDGSGLELLAPIRERNPAAFLVVMAEESLESSSERLFVHRAMVVPKPVPPRLVEVVASWVWALEPAIAQLSSRLTALGLTPRETELFLELATGTTAEITALRFGISPRTVRAHCRRVYARLGASSLAE